MEEKPWLAQYDPGVPATVDYERICLPDVLKRTAQRYPENEALVFMNRRITYSELQQLVQRFACALTRMGVEPGQRVAIQLPNLPQAVIAFYGALAAGAQVVMTNPLYTPREIEHQWGDSQCVVAITADFIWEQTIQPNRGRLHPKQYIVASIPEYLGFPLNWLAPLKLKRQDPPRYAKVKAGDGVQLFKELVQRTPPQTSKVELNWDDVAVLQYTGGTTGPSKGAMLTHANLSSNVQQIAAWFSDFEYGDETILTCLPLFHVFGLTACMNFGVWAGARLVLEPNPRDLPRLAKVIAKEKVTLFPGVPALFNGLNNLPGIENADLSSVKSCFSGSAPIADEVLKRFEQLTGARIVEAFGMSETSPATHVNPLQGTRKIGTVGIPIPDTDSRIIDIEDESREMPIGEEGELIISGPQVMKGYWDRPEETAHALRDGWMHTGDLAIMDAEGYFKIVGRKKDMINSSGMKVFPDEVDGVLMAHDRVLEAATIGVPDEKRGEVVKSFIVLQPGQTLSAQEVEAYCRENLAPYKVPRHIEFLDELPKSSVMKVLRRELRDR